MDTQQTPKIPFYAQRPFGEKMNASFDFIKENWKVMLKYITYLVLPLCLIQALLLNKFMGDYLEAAAGNRDMVDLANAMGKDFSMGSGLLSLCTIIGFLLLTSLVFALVKLYNDREERLKGITFADISPLLFRNMGRLFLLGFLFTGLVVLAFVVIGLLAALSGYTLILTAPALIAVIVALAIWTPIYLFENIGIFASFAKAFRMGFVTWGGIFGVLFVMGIIASVLQGVFTMPWYLTVVVNALFSYSTGEGVTAEDPSFLYSAFVYILGIIQVYSTYISMVFAPLGLSYQYAHASEKLDSITVESEIDNFENL